MTTRFEPNEIARNTAKAAALGAAVGAIEGESLLGAALGATRYGITHIAAADAAQDEWDRIHGPIETSATEAAHA